MAFMSLSMIGVYGIIILRATTSGMMTRIKNKEYLRGSVKFMAAIAQP